MIYDNDANAMFITNAQWFMKKVNYAYLFELSYVGSILPLRIRQCTFCLVAGDMWSVIVLEYSVWFLTSHPVSSPRWTIIGVCRQMSFIIWGSTGHCRHLSLHRLPTSRRDICEMIWLQILESHDWLARLRNVGFPSIPLESTQSDPLACTARTQSVLSNSTSRVIYILKNLTAEL